MTPHDLRSFTRSTLLMTSLPMLSNTRTFHIGSPSSFRMGAECEMRPFAEDASWCDSPAGRGSWFRLRIFSIEAVCWSARAVAVAG